MVSFKKKSILKTPLHFGGKQIPIQPILPFIQMTDKQILGCGERLHSTLYNSLTKQQSVHADRTCVNSLPFFKRFSTLTLRKLFLSISIYSLTLDKKVISLHLQVFQRRICAALNLEDEVSTKCLNDPRVV